MEWHFVLLQNDERDMHARLAMTEFLMKAPNLLSSTRGWSTCARNYLTHK